MGLALLPRRLRLRGGRREPGLGLGQLSLHVQREESLGAESGQPDFQAKVRSQAGHSNILGLSFPLENGEPPMRRCWKGNRI